MKFIILTQFFPPEIGAAHTRLQALVRGLKDLGHEIQVVTALPNYPMGRIFPEYRGYFYRRDDMDGVPIHRTWLYASQGGGIMRVLSYVSFALTALYGLFRAGKADYLFVESPPPILSLTARFYSIATRAPFILNVSDLWPDAIIELGLLKNVALRNLLFGLESWSYRKAAYVNAITEGIRDTLLNEKGVPKGKLLYLPNGVDTRCFKPQPPDTQLKQKLGLNGKKVVLYAGTQGSAHGLDYVLQAARLLKSQTDIHLVFLGDGSERKRLEGLKGELELDNVTFLDPVSLESLPAYLSVADAGLASLRDIPLFDSARPSKMFPVMASGKPMIFFGKGEGARLVECSRSGIVVPPADSFALAHAVARLLGDERLVRELGSNGRKYVEEHYQWSGLIRDWVVKFANTDPEPPVTA
jgi:glycosyltransferase involved in cell wall biosynthesis